MFRKYCVRKRPEKKTTKGVVSGKSGPRDKYKIVTVADDDEEEILVGREEELIGHFNFLKFYTIIHYID